jgi:hypothetical protein
LKTAREELKPLQEELLQVRGELHKVQREVVQNVVDKEEQRVRYGLMQEELEAMKKRAEDAEANLETFKKMLNDSANRQ